MRAAMIIKPRTWGFVSTTAHPAGCAANVREQIARVRAAGVRDDGPRRVLVIGASTGYGLAARITAAFGFGAATLGVFLEKPARGRKTASAGWYNAAAFENAAREAGLVSVSLNADAFAETTRARAIELIGAKLGGPVDLVIYSLAAPSRRLPESGKIARSALRPIGAPFEGTTIDTDNDRLAQVSVTPADTQEIADTIAVMGGETWRAWIDDLHAADMLCADARTLAFSYIGPQLTWPIYREGTIGRAKAELERTARAMSDDAGRGDFARVAILKSIVSQASVAIPVIPLYFSILLRVMRERDLAETAIDQQSRLFGECLYSHQGVGTLDEAGRWRLDDRELAAEVQTAVKALWPRITNDNLFEATDYADYKRQFLRLYGFARADIDYAADVDPAVAFDPYRVRD
jgi:enoyl-[acyl-carrier protein] reductase/trans-2-enoyl-CoA reductase (NAD+)